jgi:hypothetical protein
MGAGAVRGMNLAPLCLTLIRLVPTHSVGRAPGKLDEVLGDLGADLMEAMRVRRQRRRHLPAARGGHLGSAATSSTSR